MYSVEVSAKIKSPASSVFRLIQNPESFPAFMRDIKTLKIIKHINHHKFITLWETEIDGAPLRWKQEDNFDERHLSLKFHMLEGDYHKYSGHWQVAENGNSCRLSLSATFDWGIPVLENYVNKALEKKARKSLRGMVQAIKRKIENSHV